MSEGIKQLTHSETNNLSKTFPLVVLCEDFQSPQNIGMVFRICEIMGVQTLYLTGLSTAPPNRKISKTARSAEKKVPFIYDIDTAKIIAQLKTSGYVIIGLEITNQSKDIRTFDFKSIDKIAFIVGTENYGISEATLKTIDAAVQIPMYGSISSMNVATALSIGLYEITKQWETGDKV